MIKSMTGYGRGQIAGNGRDITVELRSVNHRYFDCSIRAPRGCAFLEEPVKAALQKQIARGKVDVFITIDTSRASNTSAALDEAMVRAYLDIAQVLQEQYGVSNDLSASRLMRMPDVLTLTTQETDEDELRGEVLSALETALAGHGAMAQKEGARLAEDIVARLDAIIQLVDRLEVRSPQCVAEYRQKLEALIRTFFNTLHGYHVQYNIVSRETLIDAQLHPEDHKDLIVRVAGYSAFFNVLSKQTQDDIIARTEQTL